MSLIPKTSHAPFTASHTKLNTKSKTQMLGQVRKRAYRLRCGLGQRICAAAAAAEHRSPARPWPRILMQEAPGKKPPKKNNLTNGKKK